VYQRARQHLERPLRRTLTLEPRSAYGGCTLEPVPESPTFSPPRRPEVAVTVSSRLRQEADFRCTSQGWPMSGVGEVRELALPATTGRSARASSRGLGEQLNDRFTAPRLGLSLT
jgi:hypothetical protein